MEKYTEIEGDLIELALKGSFQVIAQGNNCFCVQGAGLAPQMVKAFGTDKYPMEDIKFRGDINKLGCIDYMPYYLSSNENNQKSVIVVNCYSQYGFGANHSDGTVAPLDYEALTLCLRKMNHIFEGKHIGLPLIGTGLAQGDWNIVKSIIKKELIDMQVTVVKYKPN